MPSPSSAQSNASVRSAPPRDAAARQGLLKISDLTRETGVSTATIKSYIREGLLPAPTLKTGRNMAYYDHSFVENLRLIRELREKRFLPLDVIKVILEQNEGSVSAHEVETLLGLEGPLFEAVHSGSGRNALSRAEVLARYNATSEDLQFIIDLEILTPEVRDGTEYFEGDDLLILETFRAMDDAGITKELIPHSVSLPIYAELIEQLAREELKMFTRSVTGKFETDDIADMALPAMKLAEQLIVLLRRKLLLKAIHEFRNEIEQGGSAADSIATG